MISYNGRSRKCDWDHLDEHGKLEFSKTIFDYYRKNGFPYYSFSRNEKKNELRKLVYFFTNSSGKMIHGDTIKMTMHGLSLAWSYFPHSWGVKCGSMKTPMEVFMDDNLFMKAIRRRMERGTYFSDSGIRKALKTFTGTQGVSNFKPTTAASIYKMFCPRGGVTWDMSCGYGGRLIGAIASGVVGKYIGTEPCKNTFDGIIKIGNELCAGIDLDINMVGSEEFEPNPSSIDLCFTSPPYFDTEKYSDEPTQSFHRFKSVDDWDNGFLAKTIKNCWIGLRCGGHIAINVANVKTHKNLEQSTFKKCVDIGFTHVRTLNMLLSSISKGGYKSEPIFIFRKL